MNKIQIESRQPGRATEWSVINAMTEENAEASAMQKGKGQIYLLSAAQKKLNEFGRHSSDHRGHFRDWSFRAVEVDSQTGERRVIHL